MRIYVDFDDCLCETGRAFSKLVLKMFNKHIPYECDGPMFNICHVSPHETQNPNEYVTEVCYAIK